MRIRKITLIMCICFLTLLPGALALAVGNDVFDLSRPDPSNPGRLIDTSIKYSLKPGETKSDEVIVTNRSDKPVTFKVYAVDAIPTNNGGIALLKETDKKEGVGSWISFPFSQFTLASKEREIIPFTIKIPQLTDVGEHWGGIAVENMETIKGEGQFAVNLVQRAALMITETVPGTIIEKLDFTNFYHAIMEGKVCFYFVMENSGNVHLRPTSLLEITDVFGRKVETMELENLGTVLPKKSSTVPVVWEETPKVGYFTAVASINYAGEKTPTQKVSFILFSREAALIAIAAIATLLLIICLTAWLTIRHTRKKERAIT